MDQAVHDCDRHVGGIQPDIFIETRYDAATDRFVAGRSIIKPGRGDRVQKVGTAYNAHQLAAADYRQPLDAVFRS